MLLLFGIIASVGMETLIKNSVDLAEPRNMIIVALIFVCAIGGMVLDFGAMSFSGVGLGALIGITLNLVLPKTKHFDGY
jgi:uracil permease